MVHMIIEMVSIVVLPLPPEMAKGAGYDAPRTASHRDLSWRPFCSTSTSLTCGASNRDTYLCPPYNNSSVFPTTTTTYMQCSGRIINGMQSGRTTPQDSASTGATLPRRAWVRLNRLRTGVGRFRSCLYKWSMASSAACESGA